ncbi:SGNH/GDSL hydrolase family protein [Calidifontibacter sp. DB0510]|uniref:SGNH/GDSL hydrolase family protein n=1 Tax=Metallococcus carri TaxID=1656884 RepID=A0A967B0S7_9MICO|nr:SGNH/GDSL hydrolase family protein [Metallococcus carri]NOP36227.1 SGNH/GDSL hydrolase family protein [Calidifontibacter sp. DB2511S]
MLAFEYGYNDPEYYTPAEFGVALRQLISQTRANGYSGPIVLVGMPQPNMAPEWKSKDWGAYLAEMKAIAAVQSNNVAYIGLNNAMPAYPNGPYWADTVHLNEAGCDLAAQLLTNVLG